MKASEPEFKRRCLGSKAERTERKKHKRKKGLGKRQSRSFANSAYLWFPPKVSMQGSGSLLGNRVPWTGTQHSDDKGKHRENTQADISQMRA